MLMKPFCELASSRRVLQNEASSRVVRLLLHFQTPLLQRCSAAALSSMEALLRLMPPDSITTSSMVTRENLHFFLNFELGRERLRIPPLKLTSLVLYVVNLIKFWMCLKLELA